ncbi:MAG: alanine racemase [Verrucomicrobiota bacterium]
MTRIAYLLVCQDNSKGGFNPGELREAMDELSGFGNLKLQGLMVIPPFESGAESVRPWFVKARELRDELQQQSGVPLPELSMGMSGDFEVAIEEGSNIVRVGSAIFGQR